MMGEMNKLFSIAAAALAVGVPGGAVAQDWTFDVSLYGWLPGLDATIDTPYGQVEADGGGGDVLENLDMAFMSTLEARNGKWGVLLDVIYADLSDDKATPLDLAFKDVQLETKMTAASGYAIYRAYEDAHVTVDAGLGFRTFSVDLQANFESAGRVRDRDFDDSETWTVPLVAGRVIAPFSEHWFATAYADAGGWSGDALTWQAFASLGHRFNERWSAQLGYRYMDIQKEIGGRDYDFALSGPLTGATFRF